MRNEAVVIRIGLALLVVAAVVPAWGGVVAGTADPVDQDENEVVVVGGEPHVMVRMNRDDDDGAYLGVKLREETEHPEGGARITDVVSGSPADEAGLEEGDIVVQFGDTPIHGPRALSERIHDRKPGDRVTLTVVRDGKKETFEVKLAERPDPGVFQWQGTPEGMAGLADRLKDLQTDIPRALRGSRWFFWPGRPKLGVQLVDITPELRKHLGGPEDAGVLVSKVLAGTPAEKAGVRVGDLITELDDEEIADSSDLIHALMDKDGKTVRLQVVRDGKKMTLDVVIPKAEEKEEMPTGPRASLMRRQFRRQLAEAARAGVDAREIRRQALELAREVRERTREQLREAQRDPETRRSI